jgi:hypothetical protein
VESKVTMENWGTLRKRVGHPGLDGLQHQGKNSKGVSRAAKSSVQWAHSCTASIRQRQGECMYGSSDVNVVVAMFILRCALRSDDNQLNLFGLFASAQAR